MKSGLSLTNVVLVLLFTPSSRINHASFCGLSVKFFALNLWTFSNQHATWLLAANAAAKLCTLGYGARLAAFGWQGNNLVALVLPQLEHFGAPHLS